MWLENMLCESDQKVLVATSRGVLLKGDGRSGFEIATDVARERVSGRPFSFTSMVRFQNELYCGGSSGLYRLGDDKRWEMIIGPPGESVYASETGLATIPATLLQVIEDTLWAFGPRSIAKFDGTR